MVRNFRGGNKGKKGAKSRLKSTENTKKIRYAKDGEMYAKVTKLYGHGMAEVLCTDGVVRLLVIRKKFKGRNKRDNNVSLHAIILVGIREWEVVSGKKEKVDLLYVYSKTQQNELKVFQEEDKDDLVVFQEDDLLGDTDLNEIIDDI